MTRYLLFLLSLLSALYISNVPSESGFLPGYKELNAASDPLVAYPVDLWPEHGDADLPFGRTHYSLMGPKHGKRIVFIHGISIPAIAVKDLLDHLAKTHRVLVYDLYGRGYSDSPGTAYNEALYVSQAALLLQKLHWLDSSSPKFSVFGYSLGGAIAVKFAELYNDRMDKLVLMAPAGLLEKVPLGAKLLQTPFLGELVMHTIGKHILTSIFHKQNPGTDPVRVRFRDIRIHHAMLHHGFRRAYISTVRHFPLGGMEREYALVNGIFKNKTMVIWGSNDHIVPSSLIPKAKDLLRDAHFEIVDGASHNVGEEKPLELARTINAFLSL